MTSSSEKWLKLQKSNYSITQNYVKYKCTIENSWISVKKFRMKILEIIIDTINRYSKLRDFSLSFVLS